MRIISLTYLFAILLCASCRDAPAPPAPPPASEQATLAVAKLGGKVETDLPGSGKRVIGVDLHKSAVQDADLVVLASLIDLKNRLRSYES